MTLALTALSISVVILFLTAVAAILYQIDYQKSKEAAAGTPVKWYFSHTFRIVVGIGLGLIGTVFGIIMIAAVFYIASQRKSDEEGKVLAGVEQEALREVKQLG